MEYERVRVTLVELTDHREVEHDGERDYRAHHPHETVPFQRVVGVMDLLDMIAGLPLKDQILMVSNVLTIAGHSQKEIAEALGIPFKTYRNRLMDVRKDILRRDGMA